MQLLKKPYLNKQKENYRPGVRNRSHGQGPVEVWRGHLVGISRNPPSPPTPTPIPRPPPPPKKKGKKKKKKKKEKKKKQKKNERGCRRNLTKTKKTKQNKKKKKTGHTDKGPLKSDAGS